MFFATRSDFETFLLGRQMIRFITLFLALFILNVEVKSQGIEDWVIQFDKPFYTSGEVAWFAIFYTDRSSNGPPQEVIHFELISPGNEMVTRGKIKLQGRLAKGYITFPNDLENGYYRFRIFSIRSLNEFGYYLYADIPVYSEWTESLTVYKNEEVTTQGNEKTRDVLVDRERKNFECRDSLSYTDLIGGVNDGWQYALSVQPKSYEDFPPIKSGIKTTASKIQVRSGLEIEDSLYFEAKLTDMETGETVTSPLISIFVGRDKKFYRAKANDGWFSMKLPDYEDDITLQVFNLNPYQKTVNDLTPSQWTINDGYFNPTKPPISEEIANYLIKAKQRRKIYDLFAITSELNVDALMDSSSAIPDAYYNMADYQYITNLQDFVFEAIPGARLLNKEDGLQTVRLYNPERRAIFVDRPWYIVDGYLTSREEEVLKIPFNDISEIKLYVHTNTIRKYFEYFLWRNGIMEVKTKDVKYLRSLKEDPNYADFRGFLPEKDFMGSQVQLKNEEMPDLRTTMIWDAGKWSSASINKIFTLSDDTGEFIYQLIMVSPEGEVISRQGELEIR